MGKTKIEWTDYSWPIINGCPCERMSGSGQSYHHTHGALLCKKLKDKKGGDWSEWPDDLKLRQHPLGASQSKGE